MRSLLSIYERLFEESKPPWAQKMINDVGIIPPTVPFIGRDYERSRVLIYASAENLSRYQGHLEASEITITNRHRYFFDNEQNDNKYFPWVHCAPINDGSLLLTAAYICQLLRIKIDYQTPKQFLECISFANFGKFSIHLDENDSRNRDYAKDTCYLQDSFRYVKADLMELRPEYVIIPKSIYDHNEVRQLLMQCVPHALIFPIYQINVGNINRIINHKFAKKLVCELDPYLQEWYIHLAWSGKSKENFLAVFTYLDGVLSQLKLRDLK